MPRTRTTAHLHLPWKWYWRTDDNGHADCGIYSEPRPGHTYSICRAPKFVSESEWVEISEFIVRACASHEELLATLTFAADEIGRYGYASDARRIRAVINSAKGR